MPSKQGTAPTLRGAGITPACPKCGHSKHVIRMWVGKRRKVWVCSVHYKVTSTKKQDVSLMQRVLHRLPEPEEFTIPEILPNRAARRRR